MMKSIDWNLRLVIMKDKVTSYKCNFLDNFRSSTSKYSITGARTPTESRLSKMRGSQHILSNSNLGSNEDLSESPHRR